MFTVRIASSLVRTRVLQFSWSGIVLTLQNLLAAGTSWSLEETEKKRNESKKAEGRGKRA